MCILGKYERESLLVGKKEKPIVFPRDERESKKPMPMHCSSLYH